MTIGLITNQIYKYINFRAQYREYVEGIKIGTQKMKNL